MGYHVSIIRTSAGQAVPITREELVRALPAMNARLDWSLDREPWTELVEPAKSDDSELLVFTGGQLWASTPSDGLIALMIELADLLGAWVRGDELETYRTPDDLYTHPDDVELLRAARAVHGRRGPRSTWSIWKGRVLMVAVVLLAGAALGALRRFGGA